MNDFNKDFMSDVARGDSTKLPSLQKMPEAKWMTLEDIQKNPLLAYDPKEPGDKVLIGAIDQKFVGIADNRHILTVAGSRSGKSVGLISNLFFYRGSVLATDPKGELARLTAEARRKLGQEVFILDPFGIAGGSASYNPMAHLTLTSLTVLEDAALIAQSMVVQEAGQKDPHWDDSARDALIGWIVHVATDEEFAGRRNLLSVRELVVRALQKAPGAERGARPALYDEMIANAKLLEADDATEDIGLAIRSSAESFYSKGEGELAGVYSTIGRHTEFLNYRSIRNVLERSDFSLNQLKSDRISIYLCFPATRTELAKRWMRLFVNQLLYAMESEKTKPQVPVLVCLDEFAVLGYMKQIEMAAGQIASFGVKLWIVMQDWSQGKSLYGDRWETFVGNAGIMQFFGNTDLTTTKYISEKLGKAQVEVTRQEEITTEQKQKGLTGKYKSIQLYDLLTPDEVSQQFARNDRRNRQLILWTDGKLPMMLQRVIYHDKKGPLFPYLPK